MALQISSKRAMVGKDNYGGEEGPAGGPPETTLAGYINADPDATAAVELLLANTVEGAGFAQSFAPRHPGRVARTTFSGTAIHPTPAMASDG